jgi:hypothetical protein
MAVSATLQRLTAVEREIKGLRSDMRELRTDLHTGLADLRGDLNTGLADLRGDLNTGLGALLAALDRLTGKIDEVAAVRPQLADLERRVTRLEEGR